jgi:CheY-like chemotaxis protein
MRGTCIDITERVLAEQERERSAARFRALVESAPEAMLVVDTAGTVLQANNRAIDLLAGDPTKHALGELLPDATEGRGVDARRLDGTGLLVDVTTAELSASEQEGLIAVFLQDAAPRLEREAMATRLGESQQRRRQAVEINAYVVLGLADADYCLEVMVVVTAGTLIGRTLAAARNMMDELLEPAGGKLQAGDLVRSRAASLDHGGPHAEEAADSGQAARTGHRILVADDAEDIRALLRLKLTRNGTYDVVGEAADGLEAVELARQLQPDLVVLDMAMPRMDGLQALPLIREAVPGVRVVVLSGFNQRTLEHEALAAGADRYVVKGGSLTDLLDVIDGLLHAA